MLHRVAVRTEYAALVDGYPALLRPFGITLSASDLEDLDALMAAMEHVDRVLDGEADPVRREQLSESVLAVLSEDASAGEVTRTLRVLRGVAIRRGILRELTALIADALFNCERIRVADDRASYLAAVEREGSFCTELALLIVPLPAAPAAFLHAIAPTANLLDKLVDLRGDHRRGEVAISPDLRTHGALAGRLLTTAWHASKLYPSRVDFTRWGLRWARRMLA